MKNFRSLFITGAVLLLLKLPALGADSGPSCLSLSFTDDPATTYVYRVGRQGAWSKPYHFTTEDPAAESLTFAYLGDVQPAGDSAAAFALWGQEVQRLYQQHPELRFAVLGGDIVNSGISLEQFNLFFQNAEPVFANIPLFSTIGNHESNFPSGKPELFLDLFAFPQNGPDGFEEELFSFDMGSCHIVVVNSWIFSGEQKLTEADFDRAAAWLKDDLAASAADWQIVVTHLPGYAVHSDTNAQKMKDAWVPIFEKYGVDLVLEGHQHVYSRSYPLYQGKIDYENGIPYIMGVSGSKFYDSADETLAERTIYNTATCQLIQINGSMLTVQTVDMEGSELDYTVVQQRDYVPDYTDVAPGSWYESGVSYAAEQSLLFPAGGETFAPHAPMTRLMLTQALYRLAGSPPVSAGSPFSDCPDRAVAWAYGAGVVTGKSESVFDPQGSLTRQELAVMLYRYGKTAGTLYPGPSDSLSLFEDQSSVAHWASDAMNWAVGCGLINGTSSTTLSPAGTATRAQGAVILMRFAKGG